MKLKSVRDFTFTKVLDSFFKYSAPTVAKTICERARRTIVIGKPAATKPKVVPTATMAAIFGDRNIAITIGIGLPCVYEAVHKIILIGIIIGIKIPSAVNKLAITKSRVLCLCCVIMILLGKFFVSIS